MGQKSFRWWFQKGVLIGCGAHMAVYLYCTTQAVPFASYILAASAFLLALGSIVLAKTKATLEHEEHFIQIYKVGSYGWAMIGFLFLLGVYQLPV